MHSFRHYYVAPQSAFDSLKNLRWAATALPSGDSFGWVLWADDPMQQAAFEAQASAALKTLAHPKISAQAAGKLAPHGILPSDSVIEAVEKIWAKFAGFNMEM